MTKIFCSFLILHVCLCLVSAFASRSHPIHKNFVRRDASSSNTREKLHVRALKYLSGRYKSLPVVETAEEQDETTTEGSTTMEPFVKITTTLPPDQINMNVFGGYFDSLFGKYLADQFNVTTKVYTRPPYAMVHYYFHGAFAPPHGAFIGEANVVNCSNVKQFCPLKSSQICLTNGTIYCVTPKSSTTTQYVDGFQRGTVDTKIKVRCRKEKLKSCEKVIPMHLPCYVEISMVEEVEHTLKKKYVAEYCVTVIAYPVPRLTNAEFSEYIRRSQEGQRVLDNQFNSLADVILEQIIG